MLGLRFYTVLAAEINMDTLPGALTGNTALSIQQLQEKWVIQASVGMISASSSLWCFTHIVKLTICPMSLFKRLTSGIVSDSYTD